MVLDILSLVLLVGVLFVVVVIGLLVVRNLFKSPGDTENKLKEVFGGPAEAAQHGLSNFKKVLDDHTELRGLNEKQIMDLLELATHLAQLCKAFAVKSRLLREETLTLRSLMAALAPALNGQPVAVDKVNRIGSVSNDQTVRELTRFQEGHTPYWKSVYHLASTHESVIQKWARVYDQLIPKLMSELQEVKSQIMYLRVARDTSRTLELMSKVGEVLAEAENWVYRAHPDTLAARQESTIVQTVEMSQYM